MAWTKEQTAAIETQGELLVSAAAGSGKTAVLTERIARHIKEGTRTEEILCVTFTNSAASEMKHRLERKLLELSYLAETDGGENSIKEAKRLRDAALAVPRANISTLHAFCAQMLRRHFSLVDLDPSFRILDDAEAEVMKQDAAEEMLEKRFASSQLFYDLVTGLGGEAEFTKYILELYSFINALPEPMGFLKNAALIYQNANADDWNSALMRALDDIAHDIRTTVEPLLLEAERQLDLLINFYPALRDNPGEEFALIRHALNGDFSTMVADFEQFSTPYRFSFRKSKAMADADYLPLKAVRDALRAEVRRQCPKVLFDIGMEMEQLNELYPMMVELNESMREFTEFFSESKRKKNVIDYNDMEHFALALLDRKEVAEEYVKRFKFIFVDEYQDTNRVQELILSRLKRYDNLFAVGDVKQSIYSFRMADPRIFLERMAQCDQGNGKRIDLNANFRSSKAVINAINGIFSRTMNKETVEIDYDERAALYFNRGETKTESPDIDAAVALRADEGDCELNIIESDRIASFESSDTDSDSDESASESDSAAEEAERPEQIQLEATLAAKRIHELMENEVIIDAQTRLPRKLNYSDFAVLLRSHKSAAQLWLQTLSLAGIPAYAQLSGGYFDAIEVRVFIDLLRIIDNRRQSIPLLSVMRSPIGYFTDEELGTLRAQSESAEWIDVLTDYIANQVENTENAALITKCAEFSAKLDYWYYQSELMSVEELVGMLLDETGYLDYCGALPGGDARRRNLLTLLERARTYERNGIRTLHSFTDFLDRLKSTDKLGASDTLGADVVRILSVHKSKGLEFPIVILASLGKQFNQSSTRSKLLFDQELGIGMTFTDNMKKRKNLVARIAAIRTRKREAAEEMRILYVGMTRARERLILIGATKSPTQLKAFAAGGAIPSSIMRANCYLKWICCALAEAEGESPESNAFLHTNNIQSLAAINTETKLDKAVFDDFTARASAIGAAPLSPIFDFKYAYPEATSLPSKLSVTGLSGREVIIAQAPDFAMDSALTPRLEATKRGTATHTLLQYVDFAADASIEALNARLNTLQTRGLIDAEEAKLAETNMVLRFLMSSLCERLKRAKKVYRELEFNFNVSARTLLPDADTDEPILLQGIIDCCFMEEDGDYVIVDYKTDRVLEGDTLEATAKRHQKQLELYSMALEKLAAAHVKERFIFMLRYGASVKV